MSDRKYQQVWKADIRAAWGNGHRNVIGIMPTGGGKSYVIGEIVKEHQGAVAVIAHRQELVGQLSMAMAKNGVEHMIIAPRKVRKFIMSEQLTELGHTLVRPQSETAVIGVDTLGRRHDQYTAWLQRVTLWVTDECFPAGTMIGDTPIEQIKVGDTVDAFNETTMDIERRKVVRLFKSPVPEYMVRLELEGHHVLYCTPGHPFWTRRGWVNAMQLRNYDEVLHVRESSRHVEGEGLPLQENGTRVLQQDMQWQVSEYEVVGNDGKDQPQTRLEEDEIKQPDGAIRESKENVRHLEADRTQSEGSGGQRETTDRSRGVTERDVREPGLRQPADRQDNAAASERTQGAEPLQDRLWEPSVEDRNRGRRGESRNGRSSKAGQKEGRVSEWVGVDNIALYKPSDSDEPIARCGDGHVYNFEVEGLHTYIADGIVVHNCHHILVKNKWGKVLEHMPNALGLGVTATPCRADGAGLGRSAKGVMDYMVEGPTMRELIDTGFLTDYRIFAPPSDVNYDQVNIGQSGEYVQKQLKTAVQDSHLIGDVVQHYLRIAPGKLGITFATDVETATDIANQFKAAGVTAEVVSAKTPDRIRADIIARFRRREIMQLVNVDLFGEGFDLPAIEVVSMARRTMSYSLYCQQFGRALRILAENPDKIAIIIDHAGNVQLHGLPDKEREWSLANTGSGPKMKDPDDEIPLRYCTECTQPYEVTNKLCPWCGHYPVPADRSKPENVDGDLHELSPEALAEMRGEVARIDEDPAAVAHRMKMAGMSGVVVGATFKNNTARKVHQAALRESIGWFAHIQANRGRTQSESYRRFFHAFGIDVLSAQALGKPQAIELADKINLWIGKAA